MIEQQLFHPVIASAALSGNPHSMGVLGHAVVLWRDSHGVAHAWADRCPHRGTKLSLGKVVATAQGDRLECPYHGWQFDASGQCTHVPALPEFTPPPSHCVTRYAVREAYGLVWVSLGADAQDFGGSRELVNVALPAFAAATDTRLRKTLCGPYDVATSAPRIVENFLDMAHFGFVHEGWLGDRSHTALPDYKVEERPDGILATQCYAWQPKSSIHAVGGAMIEYTYEVTHPYSAVLTKAPEAGGAAIADFNEAIALFVCPMTAETSRVWFCLAMNDFTSPDSKLQAFQDTIFSQDKPIIESQQPKMLPLDSSAASSTATPAEVHSAADRMSMAYRRHLTRLQVTYGTC
jgi:phenylpropionate dioxygenase-like ring-hydroxylating dioxygenase large terminal subunit